MKSIRKGVLLAAAAAIPLSLAAIAGAQEAGVRVSYSDLDISTRKGLDKLYARIHSAAGRYCESVLQVTGSRILSGYEACVTDAVNNTVHSMNLPSLSALHAERSHSQHSS